MVSMRILFVFILAFVLTSCGLNTKATESPVVTAALPDFSSITDVKEKKEAFFEFLLPLVYEANARIMKERKLVMKWQKGKRLTTAEKKTLANIKTKYRVTTDDIEEQKTLLSRRILLIPPSIVLAQAANESAWGTSRFAREGNNLFGQWCFSVGCGIVPGERNHRSKHEVKVFKSPFYSVSSYMRNLNSHEQYQDLRLIREKALPDYESIDGLQLAEGLLGYSERREEYVVEIQQMIRSNNLQDLDADPLGKGINNGQQ